MKIAFFDFDGTITTRDSLPDFIQHAVGKITYYTGLIRISPMLAAYSLKLIPNQDAKEQMLAHFFKGWEATRFHRVAEAYALQRIDKIIRPLAMKRIRQYLTKGDRVVIVSASMECWLHPWCEKHNIELIATRLEIKNKRLTGKFATKNCYGPEKVYRIKEIYKLNQYDVIHAYGDSRGDKELLEIASKRFYKPFRS